MKAAKETKIKAIDLFCGVGGLTKGLIMSGIPVGLGVDFNSTCEYAYTENNTVPFVNADIRNVTKSSVDPYWGDATIKVMVGCAPCQPFSTHANKVKGKEEGEKWNLLTEYGRLISECNPDVVSMENVPNLSNKEVFFTFLRSLKELGYHVSYSNVFCPDYGIPQNRRRLILLASKRGPINIIPPTHIPESYVTLKDVIGGLPPIKGGEVCEKDPLHKSGKLSAINEMRIVASKPGGTWEDWPENLKLECHKRESGSTFKSVYGRLSWDKPSATITTQFFSYGTGRFGHPEQNRALSLREGALIQTFPANYKFIDPSGIVSIQKIALQIGNAVPVQLGKVIGQSILNHLNA